MTKVRPPILTKMPPHASIVVHCHFFSSKNEQIRTKCDLLIYFWGEKWRNTHFPQKYSSKSQKILGKRQILAEKKSITSVYFLGKS